jgi:AraC-like DNA-binding protein
MDCLRAGVQRRNQGHGGAAAGAEGSGRFDNASPQGSLDVARKLVVYLKRPGGQAQFSAELAADAAVQDPERFAGLIAWISNHLASDLSVDTLADRVAMRPRNFARAFSSAMRQSPAKYLHSLRIDAARRLLTDATLDVTRVAAHCGFPSAEAMRVAFQRALNVAPSELRQRFRSSLRARSMARFQRVPWVPQRTKNPPLQSRARSSYRATARTCHSA